jgi:hypothetical protein
MNYYGIMYNFLTRLFIICTVVTALCSNDVRTQVTDGPHVAVISRTVKQYNIPLDQMAVRAGSEELV